MIVVVNHCISIDIITMLTTKFKTFLYSIQYINVTTTTTTTSAAAAAATSAATTSAAAAAAASATNLTITSISVSNNVSTIIVV